MNSKKNKITPQGVEYIALKKLNDYLVKNKISMKDITMDDILAKYKTFRDSEKVRGRAELEEMIADYLEIPIDVIRINNKSAFDVPNGYEGIKRGYVRVSTDKNAHKQDTARQKRELKAQGVEILYEDYASGTRDDRIEFNRMLREAKTKDIIVCTEISRLSRSTLKLIELMEFIEKNKMCLKAGNLVFDCRDDKVDPMTRGMIEMMSVFASIERNLIAERTRSGVANARAQGKQIGRKQMCVEELPEAFVQQYYLYRDQESMGRKISLEQLSKYCGCGNRKTIGKYVQIAKAFEHEYDEKLEDFRQRIKDEKELKKWREEQLIETPLDINQ